MLREVGQALLRLQASGLSLSRAASDLRQLHDRYLSVLEHVQDSAGHPHIMRILAEETVEGLVYRMNYLGIPMGGSEWRKSPPYWIRYMEAVHSGEVLDTEYRRFQEARKQAEFLLSHSYIDESVIDFWGYKEQRYAYALSDTPMPAWFVPEHVMRQLEEIVTAFGFLWFSIVDYAEEQYYAKGA